ncbi:MAG: hypothetical protein PWQ06_2663, partial [Anaerophaga sp.]|nr:hypothetical protein [Anaerophaga sp.]
SDSFSSSNMVQTNLSFTDAGIKKYFPADVVSNFIYPIGASGKYTPVVMNITSNGNEGGSIRVKAANEPHITIPVEDLSNVLQYNWTLDAEGISNFTADVAMHGYPGDVPGTNGDEYITARILDEGEGIWNKYSVDDFDEVNTILNFSFSGTNDAGIDGDYTAGTDGGIPDKVQTFVTMKNGFWDDPTVWSVVGGGVVPGGGPNGAIVQINHAVDLQINGHQAYMTRISGTGVINVGNTLNHRLGKVSGTGTVVVESGSLPAGEYTEFFSENGGTLEYSGNTDYPVLAELPQVNNLAFSGSGNRILPNLDIDILGDFTIEGGNVINEESRLLTIRGDMSRTGGSFDSRQGDVKLQGEEVQTINGSFTDANALYNLEIDNVAGLTLNGPVDVENVITFTKGIISTSETALLTVLNSANSAVSNASYLRYVNGPMQKKINAGTMFDFPVGDDYRYGNIGVKPATTGLWTAQYFDHAASADGYSQAGVTYVSQNEYWRVEAANADNAEINLRWDSESGVNPLSPDFLVISYEPLEWSTVNYGNKTGDISGGSVITETLSHNTERLFTFGSGSIAEYTWLGTNGTDWFNGDNWAGGFAPSAANSVKVNTLNSSNNPVIGINMDAYCSSLTIETGKTVTLKPGSSLEITNDVNNSGTIILESTNSNLSSLMLPDSPTNMGTVNVKLDLEANKKFYLSSPVKNAQLAWFYPDGDIDNDYVYVFRKEPTWRWIRVDDAYKSGNPDLGTMEAVAAVYLQGKTLDYSGELYNSDVSKISDGYGFFLLGNPYPAAIDWEYPAGWIRDGFSNTMWSWITIDGERIIQTYNNGGDELPGEYSIVADGYDASTVSHIPPYQSVWLKQETTGEKTITVKRAARVKESDAPLKSASNETFSYNLIRIQTDNNILIDGTVIYFNETFTEGAGEEDSEKQFNSSENVPEIYTRINDAPYAINGLPVLTEEAYSVSLSVRNRVEGEVTIKVDLSQFSANYEVYLEDKATGSWTNLKEVNEYVYTPTQMGDDHDRFVLHLEKVAEVPTSVEEPEQHDITGIEIIGQKEFVVVCIGQELLQTSDATIEVMDINGRLMNSVNTNEPETEVDLPDNSGVFVIRVNAGGVVETGKVVRSTGQ